MKKRSVTRVMGMDISLNHGAIVVLDDGKMVDFAYYTDAAGSANRSKRGYRIVLPNTKDRGQRSVARLAMLENYLDKKILAVQKPQYVGLEDYAIRAEQGAHYLGEIGGITRILCWFRGFNLRLHDPTSVKMYIAHDGTCQKDSIEKAVLDRWGVDFSDVNTPAPKPNKKTAEPKQNRRTSEDLADAYGIAQMVWAEVQLRRGDLGLSDFHEKEIRVFHRITKSSPVCLLERDWITNPYGKPTAHGEPVCEKCGSRRCCLAK
jgi:hypothetical protein